MFRVKTTRRNVKRTGSPTRPTSSHTDGTIHTDIQNYFMEESNAALFTKPWLRLERGIRLQKYRIFSNEYPELTDDEKDTLYKTLVKANDAKLLNTKQQVNYDAGKIVSIKGLKVVEGTPRTFKIEASRSTKKNTDDTKEWN